MSTRAYFIYVSLLLAACVLSWVALQAINAQPIKQNTANRPDAFMVQVVGMRMDVRGMPQDQLISSQMVHFPVGDITDISNPHFIIFNTAGQPLHITAKFGQAQQGTKRLVLWDQVRFHQAAGANNRESTLVTSELTIYPKQQYAETQQPVTAWQLGSVVKSVGMRANLKNGTIDLLSQTRGVYQPNTQP